VYYVDNNGNPYYEEEITSVKVHRTEEKTNSSFNLNNYGLFLDVTAGASRIGPSVGLRYVYNFNAPEQQIHAYAVWKF